MSYPQNVPGTRIAISVTREGIFMHGNSQAFETLSRWMKWIAAAPEEDHYELHLRWHLTSGGIDGDVVSVRFDADVCNLFASSAEQQEQFEISFMSVSDKDISQMGQ